MYLKSYNVTMSGEEGQLYKYHHQICNAASTLVLVGDIGENEELVIIVESNGNLICLTKN
jgi:hypothetical protein